MYIYIYILYLFIQLQINKTINCRYSEDIPQYPQFPPVFVFGQTSTRLASGLHGPACKVCTSAQPTQGMDLGGCCIS